MPIRIPDALPAAAQLESENIFVMTEYRALHQDIRPLRVLILNLMPTKIATETQIMRKLSNTPLQVEVDLLRTKTHEATHVSADHLVKFYETLDAFKDNYYDGFVVTGAPVEHMPFEDVDYWDEFKTILDWASTHVFSTMYLCWGAMGALNYRYGVRKELLPEKLGHYVRVIAPKMPLLGLNGSYIIAAYECEEKDTGILFFYNMYRDEYYGELRAKGIPGIIHQYDAKSIEALEAAIEKHLEKDLKELYEHPVIED